MTENGKPIKLVGRQQIIALVSVVLVGLGIHCYRRYSQKGYLDAGDAAVTAITGILCLSIVGILVWYSNKPEKKEKQCPNCTKRGED